MKKIIVIAVMIAICLTYANEHVVMVERNRNYSYGEEVFSGKIFVRTEEIVRDLRGNLIATSKYEEAVDVSDLPWYNVWTEKSTEIR